MSGTEGVSHVSVKQRMLQSLMSRWKLVLALRSSILFSKDWTGSKTRRTTSEISKGNVLGNYSNLGSLRYGNEYCIPGRAMSCTPRLLPSKKSEMRWQSSWLYSQMPLPFWRAMAGCLAIGSRTTAVHWFIFNPTWTNRHAVITAWLK